MIKVIKSNELQEDLISFFKNRSIIPIVGSGLSCGLQSCEGKVPSADDYRKHMVEKLAENVNFTAQEKNEILKSSFSSLCEYYEDDDNVNACDRQKYLKKNFSKVYMKEDYRKKLLEIDWPYIYSLNLDDAIENSSQYSKIVLPNKEFSDDIFNEEKCVIKLHGDISDILTYSSGMKIFTTKEYALSINRNAAILNKLKNDYMNQNILFIGCSLDDEIDLLTIADWPFDYKNKENISRTIIFVKGKPTSLQLSKYKRFGVTDVVYFDDYKDMYTYLYKTWKASLQIFDDELDDYTNITTINIPASENNRNQEFFFWGNSIFNLKNDEMSFPYFFTKRVITSEVLDNIDKNKIHLLFGAMLSGKTYILSELYITIKDRPVFFFDGRARLSKRALDLLLSKENIVGLFDVGVLTKDQLEYLILNAKMINSKHNNFVICVNYSDSDTLGVVKWKLKEGYLGDGNDVISYNIKNRLNSKEIDEINDKYPLIKLPQYSKGRNFTDQILYAEDTLETKSRFSDKKIQIKKVEQLVLLIILAIKEKMYSLDIISFELDMEIADAVCKYRPFIERTMVKTPEKENSDLSNIKYVLNSKYWLRRELGNYADDDDNRVIIADAYAYIINHVIRINKGDEVKLRRMCRDYVLFDVMDDIFLDKHKNNIELIVSVYSKLYFLLSNDYNFLHQNAKCYLNYADYLKVKKEKMKYLLEALKLVILAQDMVDKKNSKAYNEKLSISYDHIQFTRAVILCEICRVNEYKDNNEIERALEAVSLAWLSPYNVKECQKDKKERTDKGTVKFINRLVDKCDISTLSKKGTDRYNDMLQRLIDG